MYMYICMYMCVYEYIYIYIVVCYWKSHVQCALGSYDRSPRGSEFRLRVPAGRLAGRPRQHIYIYIYMYIYIYVRITY